MTECTKRFGIRASPTQETPGRRYLVQPRRRNRQRRLLVSFRYIRSAGDANRMELPSEKGPPSMIRTSLTFAESATGLDQALPALERMTRGYDVFHDAQTLDVDAWNDTLRLAWGRYKPAITDPKAFVAKIREQNLYGLSAMHLMPNASRVERTQRDARLDGMDHYYALFSIAGTVTVIQDDQAVELSSGQVLLIDSARSVTYIDRNEQRPGMSATNINRNNYRQCFVLQLPRQSLVSHLGFEPQYGPSTQWNTRAGQMLLQLAHDSVDDDGPMSNTAAGYMRLVIYDLIGAIFSPPDSAAYSRSDKLFRRVCNVVRARFTDPSVNPDEVAAEVGISRRYLQKLFAMRNSTFTHFLNSVRLDHAERLLRRRAVLDTIQPISTIAYTSGFGDYANFARQFRNRFGHAPGAHPKSRD
jgi:AraC family transcriptional regulator, positive regulator of tynA and feaB